MQSKKKINWSTALKNFTKLKKLKSFVEVYKNKIKSLLWISRVSVFHCYVAVSAAPFLSDFNFPGPLRNANDFVVACVKSKLSEKQASKVVNSNNFPKQILRAPVLITSPFSLWARFSFQLSSDFSWIELKWIFETTSL